MANRGLPRLIGAVNVPLAENVLAPRQVAAVPPPRTRVRKYQKRKRLLPPPVTFSEAPKATNDTWGNPPVNFFNIPFD